MPDLRGNLAGVSLSTVILAGALMALALWLWRSNFKERILLWFGLFALIYSIRELTKNELILMAFGISRGTRDLVVSWMDFLVVVPGVLFFEEVLGQGWRSSLRWAAWILAAYAGAGIVLGVASGKLYFLPDPAVSILLPLIGVVALLNVVNGYRRPAFPDIPIVLAGLGTFTVFVLGQHWLPGFHAEQVGFFALICCLGTVAVRRMLRKERKLLDVEQEMAAARQIQASILPSEVPRVGALNVAVRYSPMTSVARDFYDFAELGPNATGILVADVAGHGVPAALIASMVKVAFTAQQAHAWEPGRVLSGLNRVFCGQLLGHYVTAGYLVINREKGVASYSGAGHPPLMVWRATTGQVEKIENNGLFLGFRMSEVYPELQIHLSAGDRVLLYTDGLLEASNAAGESFSDALDGRVARYRELSANAFADALMSDLKGWTQGSGVHAQEDDLTLVVVDVAGAPNDHADSTPLQSARV